MKEVSEKYMKEIYLNVLKAVIIVLYFLILNLAYENINIQHLQAGIKIFAMLFLFISIYIFEKAYKKDDEKLAIQGIEILILSTYTLTTEHITNRFNFNFKSYSLVASYIFAIYFILKSIIAYTKGRKEIVQQFSDIREIVKKDEPIKKEATKKSNKEKVHDIIENKKTKISKRVKNTDLISKVSAESKKKVLKKEKDKKIEVAKTKNQVTNSKK